MIEYHKYECARCKNKITKYEQWEDEYSKKRMLTCLTCGYIVGTIEHKLKIKEVLL